MAKRQWTSQQLKAIEADGTLTVLSAAAGSGKTTVLVEKALRILLDEENKTPADRLLIVTFSNASAKEFKNRIEKGINEAIKENPENAYIKSQKVALQKADISTIHSFCIKLTRENFELLDIAPDFTVCDDAKSLEIHSRAIDAAMEYGYENPDFRRYVSLFGKSSQDKQIREFLRYMHQYFSALPFPEKRAAELAERTAEEKFEDSAVYKFLWEDIGEQIRYIKYLHNRQKMLVYNGDVDAYLEGVMANGSRIDMLINAYLAEDVFVVKSIANEKLYPLGRLKKGEGTNFSDAVKTVNEKIKDMLKSVAADVEYLDAERYYEDNRQASAYIKAITDVFIYYSQKLMEIKKAEKTFEFSDFEHFAVKLLIDENGSRTAVADSLQQKYVKIMEDEFQDTSFVQDMIFKTIAKDRESNLFLVGDVKQSIYGFRKASPQILLEKRARQNIDPSLGTTIVLPNNFRSEVNVIRGVNYLFEQIMTEKLGGVDYRSGEQLLPAPNKTDSGTAGTELVVVTDKDGEAAAVAEKIYTMVSEGYEISENGTMRPVGYSDFCILLRNKRRFDEFSDALKAKGIKSFVRDEEPLLEKPEIQSIIALLRVINNPLQEVYLTAGMFGDMFGFTLDDILGYKLKNKKENLYRLMTESEDAKAKDFLDTLRDFAFAAKIYSPDKLTDYIINRTGYYTKLSFAENGAAKRENIRRFISLAKKYAAGHQGYLGDFLRYIDLTLESGNIASENFRQPADTVAIMTMHTSKGLEFPICFISGLGSGFNKRDSSKRLMIDPELGMATYVNESFGHNRSTAGIRAIGKKILRENANDEMRLMYVAMTRAKNKMFLTAQYTNLFTENTMQKIWEKTSFVPEMYALRTATNPMEWVLTGFINHPKVFGRYSSGEMSSERKVTFEKVGIDDKDIFISDDYDFDAILDFQFLQAEDTDEAEQPCPAEENTGCTAEISVEKARENLNRVYHNRAKTRLPIKVSVGEVAKAPHAVSLRKPDFVKQQHFSAAEKGTQMHLFAQHSDILLARTDLDGEISRLSDKGVVDIKLLNKKQIEKFVYSDVATVILNGEKIYREKEFLVSANARTVLGDDSFEGQEILVQGVIDCLVMNGRQAVVIDYKTDRVDSMEMLYERYSKQLEMYRFAAESLYETDSVKCIIYSFYLGEYMEF